MFNFKYLIIEDELLNARRLERMLNGLGDCQIQAIIQTVEEAVQFLKISPEPDIIFMDIQLLDGMSFEIFDQVEITSPVIFLTGFDQYALKAFEVNAVDYLLKPFTEQRLLQAIQKARRNISGSENKALLEVFKSIRNQNVIPFRQRFLVSFRDRFVPVAVEDIAYFYNENKITRIITSQNQRYVLEGHSLNQLEAELDPTKFLRITRQIIIHINAIESVYSLFNGQVGVELKPKFNEKIQLSRDKTRLLKEWLGE